MKLEELKLYIGEQVEGTTESFLGAFKDNYRLRKADVYILVDEDFFTFFHPRNDKDSTSISQETCTCIIGLQIQRFLATCGPEHSSLHN